MLEIPTYWNVEGLYYVFNGIAAILGAAAYASILKIALMLGLIFATWSYLTGRQWQSFSWGFSAVALLAILTLPYGSVAIVDRTGSQPPRTVANVPVFLVATGAITAQVGDWLTRTFETVFTLPDELKLGNNDLAFGHRILKRVNQVTLMDSPLRADLVQFFKECTVYDLRDGVLNPNALAASTTGWNDVFGAASPARFVSFNVMSATPGFDTCANVANGGGTVLPAQSLAQRITAAVSAMSTFYGKELNPYAASPAAAASAFDAQIAAAYNFILGSSQSAADALQQAMFVNAFREAQGDIATLLNDPAAIAQLNAETQGAVATNAALLAQANVAQDTLPRVRNIIEVFLYVVFPVVVLMCLVSSPTAAANILAFYILGLAWIALWPVMFAVLNFLMTLHLAAKAKATLLAFNGVPLQHQNLLAGLLISEQALIGSLAYAVPAIAAGLVFLSRGPMSSAFTSLASTGQAQVASEAAATTKGNYSIGQSGLNTVSENLTLKARYDGDSHFLSGFHQGRIGAYSVTQMPDGNYVVNRPVNQLGVQATDALALASGSGQSASSTLSSGRSQEAGFRIAQSAAYNESVGRWETRGTSQERTEGWSKSLSGSHATQGGEGFSFNHAAEITASFERVSGARAHGGADLGGRFAISKGGGRSGTPATMQSGVNQVQQAAGVTAEEAKHVIEARHRNMRPEEVADHLKKLREQAGDTATAATPAPSAPTAATGSVVNMNARAGLSFGAEKTLAAQTARAIRAADAYLQSEDGRRYSQAMTAFANERSYREGDQSRQEHRFDRTANYGENLARDRGERASVADSQQRGEANDASRRATGSFQQPLFIDGRELDAVVRRSNVSAGSAVPGLSALASQSLTPLMRSEFENRMAERAMLREVFMSGQTVPSDSALRDRGEGDMNASFRTHDPLGTHRSYSRSTGFGGTAPVGAGTLRTEAERGLESTAQAADGRADRRFTDERLRAIEQRAREQTSIDRTDHATNQSSMAEVYRMTRGETTEVVKDAASRINDAINGNAGSERK